MLMMYLTFNNREDRIFTDKIFDINLEVEYIDDLFETSAFPESHRKPNGLLPVLTLTSPGENLEFVCRWDQNPEVVDIDMYEDGKIVIEFKSKEDGYVGHHTSVVSRDPRKFRIDIQIPKRVIFQGYLTLNISHTIEINNLDRDIHIDVDPNNLGHIIIT